MVVPQAFYFGGTDGLHSVLGGGHRVHIKGQVAAGRTHVLMTTTFVVTHGCAWIADHPHVEDLTGAQLSKLATFDRTGQYQTFTLDRQFHAGDWEAVATAYSAQLGNPGAFDLLNPDRSTKVWRQGAGLAISGTVDDTLGLVPLESGGAERLTTVWCLHGAPLYHIVEEIPIPGADNAFIVRDSKGRVWATYLRTLGDDVPVRDVKMLGWCPALSSAAIFGDMMCAPAVGGAQYRRGSRLFVLSGPEATARWAWATHLYHVQLAGPGALASFGPLSPEWVAYPTPDHSASSPLCTLVQLVKTVTDPDTETVVNRVLTWVEALLTLHLNDGKCPPRHWGTKWPAWLDLAVELAKGHRFSTGKAPGYRLKGILDMWFHLAVVNTVAYSTLLNTGVQHDPYMWTVWYETGIAATIQADGIASFIEWMQGMGVVVATVDDSPFRDF